MKKVTHLLICSLLVSTSVLAETNSGQNVDGNESKVVVHVYRPNRVIGFGWNFNFKANGEKASKVKNGEHLTLEFEPGQTEFQIKNSSVEINLEPGKQYYLRASLIRNMFLGKPEIVEVTAPYARNELANL